MDRIWELVLEQGELELELEQVQPGARLVSLPKR
jgi:hypothetical protein